MKKAISAFILATLVITAFPATVSAHGNCRNRVSSAQSYTICSYEDCNTVGIHKHDGTAYSGHYINDGHNYHELCTVKNCTETESHVHNETTCLPHSINDGHRYHSSVKNYGGHH